MPKVLIDGNLVDVPATALFADDGTTPFGNPNPAPGAPPEGFFSAEDVARIRQEEKDKLYTRLESSQQELAELKNQVGSLTAAEQRRAAQLEEEQKRLEAEARKAEEAEMDARQLIERKEQEWQSQLTQMEQTWEQRLEEERKQREATEATIIREREFNELRDYIQAQVEANQDKIVPQLIGWIQGNSKEEVDAQVARAIETSEQIANDVQAQFQQTVQDPNATQYPAVQQPVAAPQPPPLPGTRATSGPANTDPATQYTQLTAEQIANMPMSEYAKYRSQLVGGGNQNNRGLYG